MSGGAYLARRFYGEPDKPVLESNRSLYLNQTNQQNHCDSSALVLLLQEIKAFSSPRNRSLRNLHTQYVEYLP